MKQQKGIPIAKFFPNVVTFLGLCIGLTSIKYSFIGKWEMAVIFIVFAAIIDGMDGKLARILDSTSKFGAQLDSLADLISFGVAPAFLLYFWQLKEIKLFGWALTMAFVLCMAIRLARFNSNLESEDNNILDLSKYFFTGVPAPVGAILALLPVIMGFHNCKTMEHLLQNDFFISVYIITIAFLIVSKLPTFSLKNVKIPSYLDSLIIFILVAIVILLITKPWFTIPVLSFFYICSIPFSCFYYSKLYNKH